MECGYNGVLSRGRGDHTAVWDPEDSLDNSGSEGGWCPYYVAPVMYYCRANIKPTILWAAQEVYSVGIRWARTLVPGGAKMVRL